MKPANEEKPNAPSNSGALDEAIERIYKQYGTDLPAFFRDAYKDVVKCQDKDKPETA